MGMGANRPAFTQGPHGKRKAFHDKVRSFLKDKQSMGFDPQGIYIHMYLYTTLNYKACKLTCLKNYLKYNYVSLRFSICSPYIYPPFLIYLLCFPRCGYLLEPARLEEASLCSCLFPLFPWCSFCTLGVGLCVSPRSLTALTCTSLDLARLLAVLFLPRLCAASMQVASADIAVIYPSFLMSIPGFASSLLSFLKILKRLRARDMSSQLNTWDNGHLYRELVLAPSHLLVRRQVARAHDMRS